MDENSLNELLELAKKYLEAEASTRADAQKKMNAQEEAARKKTIAEQVKAHETLKKKINESADALKKQTGFGEQFKAALKGQSASTEHLKGKIEQLDDEIGNLDDTIKSATDSQEKQIASTRKKELEDIKSTLEKQKVSADQSIAAQKFIAGLGTVTGAMIGAAFSFAKNLQSGASGVKASSDFLATTAMQTGNSIGLLGQFLAAIGPTLALVLPEKFKKLAAFAEYAGRTLEVSGKKIGEYAKDSIEFLTNEVEKTTNAFKVVNQAGAVFGGGMTELRQIAASAGLDVGQLGKVVKNARENLSLMGGGIGEATKRLGSISKELRQSNLGIELRKLGYETEEQTELAAEVAANLNASGKLRVTSDKEVAAMTVQYGKDLKILSDQTGKDAKKAAEKARTDSLKAAVYGKLNEDQRLRLQGVLRGTDESIQQGLLEKIYTGGSAIADAGTNLAMSLNQQVGDSMDVLYNTIMRGSQNSSEAQALALKEGEKMGAAQLVTNKKAQDIYAAQQLKGGNATVERAVSIANALTILGTKQLPGATDRAAAAVEASANNVKPFDVAVAKIEETTNTLRAALGETLTPAITTFANTMVRAIKTVDEILIEKGVKTATTKSSAPGSETKKSAGELAGNVIGGAAGTLFGLPGFAAGSYLGGKLGEGLGKFGENRLYAPLEEERKKAALGRGAKSYREQDLEAAANKGYATVATLPNSKVIPVNITLNPADFSNKQSTNALSNQPQQPAQNVQDGSNTTSNQLSTELVDKFGQLVTSLGEVRDVSRAQLEKHDQMLKTMQEHKDVSERIVQNTYN